MSASTDVEQVIEQRLGEIDEQLRPYADLEAERDRLQRALQALRAETSAAARASTPARRSPGRPRRQARRSPSGRAKRGSNLQAILDYVEGRPGATAAQLAESTGIDRGVVYSAVSRLTSSGRLRREQLPGGQVGYRVPADG
jgi:hypothetical protein